MTHRARVRWNVDDGSARIDDGDDGDSADYELSSSESEADETRPEPPAADLSPDAAPKPSPGAINPLGTPEPMPEFEELPKEAQVYVLRIEELLGVKVRWIGNGGDRLQMIER